MHTLSEEEWCPWCMIPASFWVAQAAQTPCPTRPPDPVTRPGPLTRSPAFPFLHLQPLAGPACPLRSRGGGLLRPRHPRPCGRSGHDWHAAGRARAGWDRGLKQRPRRRRAPLPLPESQQLCSEGPASVIRQVGSGATHGAGPGSDGSAGDYQARRLAGSLALLAACVPMD